jgi:papain like cysteine protease AvrRpt2
MPDLERPFRIQHQEQDQWCWAAVAASLCVFYQDDTGRTQCELANRFLEAVSGDVDCCSEGSSDECNVPFGLSSALRVLGHIQLPARGALSFEDLGAQISANRPVAVRILMEDFSAHFIVVTGCDQTSDGRRWVKVADPSVASANLATIEYDDLRKNYRPGAKWDQSYLTK